MRAILTVSMLAALAASGCASRDTMRALQTPAPVPQGVIRFDSEHQYRDTVAIEWVGGVSRWSYVFAEPNQRVIRPIVQDALTNSGLAASTTVRARYGLRVHVTEVDGPQVGADYDSQMVASYILIDRTNGEEVWRRDIQTPGTGYFLSFNESDWQTAWFIDPIVAVYDVANPLNYIAIASNSAADRARQDEIDAERAMRQRVVGGAHDQAMAERWGFERAARANAAAVRANVSAFLVAFAGDNDVEMTPLLPCWGSPEEEARKLEIMASGRRFQTDDCSVRR
jgi:hypothetical protein